MKAMLVSGVAVALGLLTGTGSAEEVEWRPAGSPRPLVGPRTEPVPVVSAPASSLPVVSGASVMIPLPGGANAVEVRWISARDQNATEEPLPGPRSYRPSQGSLPPALIQEGPPTPGAVIVAPIDRSPELSKPGQPMKVGNGTATNGNHPDCMYIDGQCNGCWPQSVPRFYGRAEYLLWFLRPADGPLLVTTAPAGSLGALGSPGTQVLLDYEDLDEEFRQGGRFSLGYWFDNCRSAGIEGSVFFTGRRTESFGADSGALGIPLFRPFFAVNPGIPALGNVPGEFSQLVADNVTAVGRVDARNRSFFWGADVNYRRNVFCGCSYRVDGLLGFRYANLDEELNITEDFVRLTPTVTATQVLPAGTRLQISDFFGTRNDFYGGQVGAVGEYRWDRWVVDVRATIALGVNDQRLTIAGNQVVTLPGAAPQLFTGGLLAEPSNIGQFDRQPFSVLPEVTFNVGYQLTDSMKVYIGYDFLYWTNVIRPGDQIDRAIDVTQVPNFAPPGTPPAGQTRPAVLFRDTDFWAHGVNLGLEYRW